MRNRLLTIVTLLLILCAQAYAQESRILAGKEYYESLREAIRGAKKSIYLALYQIDVEPQRDIENPASNLIEELVEAHKRGVFVKVILDGTRSSVNYNAFKRLSEGAAEAYLNDTQVSLQGNGAVIDSRVCIVGLYNWSRASLSDERLVSAYIESEKEADRLIDRIKRIKLSKETPEPPVEGLKLPITLLSPRSAPNLWRIFIDDSEKAFDIYLYLLKKSQQKGSEVIDITLEELKQVLGYNDDYSSSIMQVLQNLTVSYNLIEYAPWADYLEIKRIDPPDVLQKDNLPVSKKTYITIPAAYWDYGYDKNLSFSAKYLYLIALNEAANSLRNPYWFRQVKELDFTYSIDEKVISRGLNELEEENILEVYRLDTMGEGKFAERPVNNYRLNPLISNQTFKKALDAMAKKYGSYITRRAQMFSAQINEPKDTAKIQAYIELINKYGDNRVEATNTEIAIRRRETGLRDISQTILLLKKEEKKP